MWRSRLWLLYWVRTAILRTPALTRLERQKSISRYVPPNGTAGLARSSVRGISRLPSPPARTMPITRAGCVVRIAMPGIVGLSGARAASPAGELGRVRPQAARADARAERLALH